MKTLEVKAELAEKVTEYIVTNFTNMPLWVEQPNGDLNYYDETQDIFNNVMDILEEE